MKTMHYLKADTINGVSMSESFPDDYDVLGDMDFYDALSSCADNETLRGIVNDETYFLIKNEYGIRAQ
jgi:hypothetical protein